MPAGLKRTRAFEPEERIEDLLELAGRDTRTSVPYLDKEGIVLGPPGDLGAPPVAERVLGDVSHGAAKRDRAQANLDVRSTDDLRRIRHVGCQIVKKHTDIELSRLFSAGQVLGEAQRRLRHGLHFLDRLDQAFSGLIVVHHFGAHPERCEWRAQVMADGGKNTRPVSYESGQAFLHKVERSRQVLDLRGTDQRQRDRVFTSPKSLGRACQLLQWPGEARDQKPAHRDEDERSRRREGEGREQGPLQRRPLESGPDVQPLPSGERNGQRHLQRRHFAPHHRAVHFRHLWREVGQRQDRRLDIIELDTDIAAVAVAKKGPHAGFHGRRMVMVRLRYARCVG